VSRYIASDPALAEYAITHADYEALHDILTILNFAHRTQELLSSDKIPTLAFAIPLYHALIDQWTQLQDTLPVLSNALDAGIKKINVYLDKTRSSPVHIVAMALNPSIRYEWFDRISPSEGQKARVIVKQHVSFLFCHFYSIYTNIRQQMLRCLEEQQDERSEGSILTSNPSQGTAETATRRLNIGYSNLLASGVETRVASRSFPLLKRTGSTSSNPPHANSMAPVPSNFSSLNASSTHTVASSTTQRPTPNRTLNEATIELEHRKFEEDPVITSEELNGLTHIDYWLVSFTFCSSLLIISSNLNTSNSRLARMSYL
jgi:hypothetical protein